MSLASNQGQPGLARIWNNPAAANIDWNVPSDQLPFPSASGEDPSASTMQRLSFSTPNTQPVGQSLQSVPYQGQQAPTSQALMVMPIGFPTIDPGIQPVNPLLPTFPDGDQEAPVYVPPMYTKLRPIIPRYRTISGLISVIIVFALLCAGTGYYAQVTGKLNFFEKLLGISPPPSIASRQILPIPSSQTTLGPGANSIISAALGTRIDPQTGLVPIFVNQFTVGQWIYLSCSTSIVKTAGTIYVKWYTNKSWYTTDVYNVIANSQNTVTVPFHRRFATPIEGRVELYWNNQLARTLFFVVEPTAQ